MIYKFLLTISLTSISTICALTPIAVAQERPECYSIDNSGQLTDLTDICNVNQKRLPQTNPTISEGQNIVNNHINILDSKTMNTGLSLDDSIYILGENSFYPNSNSNLVDSAYYIDNETGIDYTAYIRRYKTSPTSIVGKALREQIFQFDAYPNSHTAIVRQGRSKVPFIIYRYQI